MTATTPTISRAEGGRAGLPRMQPWLAALVCAGLFLNGCGAAGEESAARAGSYFEAMHEASSAEFVNLAQFAAPEATFSMALYDGASAAGRPGIAQMLREDWDGDVVSLTTDEPAYVSAAAAIDPSRLAWGSSGSYTVPQAPVHRMSADGFLDYSWHASVKTGEYYVGVDPEPAETLAAAYLAAWGDRAPEGFVSLYAPGATVTDSLLGIDLTGTSALVEAAADPALSLRGAVLRQIPDDGGAALYSRQDRVDGHLGPLTGLVLLLDVPGADDCPGQVGVQLWLDAEGRVTGEERFHRVDDVDRCLDLDGREPWWEQVSIPDPGAMPVRTGSLHKGGQQIQLWNATPPREQLLRWALGRFADTMLPPPAPRSVTFTRPDPDPWVSHGFVAGSADIPLPATAEGCPDEGCARWPAESRAAALTALAHLWLTDPARRLLREEYATALGHPWIEPPPTERRYPPVGPTAHRAAHTMTWGLMDEPYPLPDDIAGLTCEQLAADFLMLTTAVASGAACASG